MATEYELKYKGDYDSLTAINISCPQAARVIEMETIYFDTPSGALSARHYMLRRRKENDQYICTMKGPAEEEQTQWKAEVAQQYASPRAAEYLAGSARKEWEVACEKMEDAIPKLIAQGAPEELWTWALEGLKSICGAKFTRIVRTQNLGEAEIELALDFGLLLGGGKSEPFYEVEIEVKSGDKVVAGRYAQDIARNFDLETERRSKFARALALYKGE